LSSVVLCMIVKNEAHVIERCLASVRPHIDAWLVVDTGSGDGTQRLVERALAGLPGRVVEREWVDFGHNRSEALELARELGGEGGYSLVVDADDVFEAPAGFRWPQLRADAYYVEFTLAAHTYQVLRLFSHRLPWRYTGVLHEYPEVPGRAVATQRLSGPRVVVHYEGGRSVGLSGTEKYARDARVLEEALQADPDNIRYQYYLARSYRDSGQWHKALAAYQVRVEMRGGFEEEVYDSLYAIAELHERLAADDDAAASQVVINAYLAAYERRPGRAEALCALARYCREHQRWALARMFAKQALALPYPAGDLLWVDESVYTWRSKDEYAVASYWAGHYAECLRACRELLAGTELPAEQRERVKANMDLAQTQLTGGGTRPNKPNTQDRISTDRAPARTHRTAAPAGDTAPKRRSSRPVRQAETAIIVPVFRRPQHAAPFMESLRSTVSDPHVYAVCDADDLEPIAAWSDAGAKVIVRPARGGAGTFAEKVNAGYRESYEPWLFAVGTDVRFHAGWLESAQAVGGRPGAKVVGTNDLANPRVMSGQHGTHLLIDRTYVDRQGASWDGPGVVCHEGYRHWYVDDEIVTVAKQRRVWASASSSVVEHLHPLFGKGQDDEVYRLGQSYVGEDGKEFERRCRTYL
jgi:hypothetical protein